MRPQRPIRTSAAAWRAAAFLLPALLPLLAACAKPEPETLRATREGVLLVGCGADPQDLDPHTVTGVTESKILSTLLEGLVDKAPGTLAPVPAAAASWEVSPDGLVYTFHLRKEATWSNGDPVRASDFVYSFKRLLDPALKSPNAYMLAPVKGAAAYNNGELASFGDVGIAAPDAHTIKITLEAPTPYFLSLLAHHAFYPVHPPTIERHGAASARGTPWTREGNFVGNGPFTLEAWTPQRLVRVARNPAYWDAASISLNAIEFRPIESAAAEEMAFRGGRLHITETVPISKIATYKRENPAALRIAPYLGVYYYVLNTARPPLDDPRVRRALSLAIDREAITRSVTMGGELPATSFTPPGIGDYTPEPVLRHDPDAARRLLAEAGYPGGKGLPPLELLYNTSESHQKIAQAVQTMWKQTLGVEVALSNQEWKVYLDTMDRGAHAIARAGWIGDYNDPNTFLDMWTTGAGNNRARWSNPDYDALIRKAAATADPAIRLATLRRAEAILMEAAPVLPLYVYTSKHLVAPDVQGWLPNILDHQSFKALRLVSPGTSK